MTTEQRCAGESHVNEPGNRCVFICVCRARLSIECLWILSEINKSAGKRVGTSRLYLYL